MAAPRSEIPIIVLSESAPLSYISGATIYVKDRLTENLVTVYSNAGSSEATITQPLSSDSLGRVTGWLPRGSYKFEITIPGKTPYTEYLDLTPGINGSIDTEFLASEAVTLTKIAASAKNAAAGTASLRSLGTGSTEAAAGNDSRLTNERTPTNGSVSTAKIIDGAVTAAKVAPEAGLVPTGAILPYGGSAAPVGFLLCNGASKAKTSFEALFAVIGYTHGGSGANFNVPDLRGSIPVGADEGAGRLDNSWAPSTRGARGGSMWLQSHSHTQGSLATSNQQFQPQQQIGNNFNNYSGQSGFTAVSGWTPNTNAVNGTTDSAGSGNGQNMPPYQVVTYIIKT